MEAFSETDWASAAELARLIRNREVSPVEIVSRSLERLEAVEPDINAFVTTTPELALAAARKAEASVMRGDALHPLTGIPISIKDNIAVEGVRLTFGSRTTRHACAAFNAPVVERLIAAGACIVGKTTMTEFGSKASSDSPLTGITRNPWNLAKSAGGSSSGSAASVAAGVTPLSIGTDGAGSLRIPASFCGVVGFKPQFGRVPVYPQATAPSLLHIGPVARNVSDAAMLLSAISGYDARDHASIASQPQDFTERGIKGISGWRIAWSPTLGFGKPDETVLGIVRAAVRVFEQAGCVVEEVDHIIGDPHAALAAEFFANAAFRLKDALLCERELFDPEVAACLEHSSRLTINEFFHAQSVRNQLRERFRELFGRYQLLLTPTVPVAAFDAELSSPPGWTGPSALSWPTYTLVHNLTGLPALSMPCGRTPEGLPVGFQVVGRPNAEADVLDAAAVFEAIGTWTGPRPS
ncbi:amidase family protein [Aurantimonas sp. C2-6-R+9]|uniref:amidase n=1 Tax=unclassified Aurantimonas TaxID=2638230 RepID=UPI002E178852|nr:amidase family protein [Aurantimonas sp. C2-6-R+9]